MSGGFEEYAQIKFDSGGNATLYVGTHNHGQGHETVFKQLIADRLGLDFASIRVVQGDTDLVAFGHGTFGLRSSGLGGAAIGAASDKIIEKCTAIASHLLEAATGDIEFADGEFRITGTDRAITFKEVACAAFVRATLPPGIGPGLVVDGVFVPPAPTFPNGCHVAEVEIDPQTGVTRIERYVVVDDVGTVMNPLLLEGQIQGGVVQGIGQVMMEEVVFEPENGQLLSGSFLDYCMPRASDLLAIEVISNPVPTKTSPLGIKGSGEAGCVGALPCVMNAILDALEPLGIHDLAMPATPERVWRAIKDAKPRF
ncbi:MAG: xanthine dehydrogenase family protein molybdopterin-binding subunit [Alphaproteobacteria bacterium]